MNHGTGAGLVLVAEDDMHTSALVALYLEREGFTTLTAADGRQALQLARQRQPCLIILDIMLPAVDGWEVCRELRRVSDVPILILTARDEELDRIVGLSMGADDYVVKPFSPRELVARVKAILRRTRLHPWRGTPQLAHKDLLLDRAKRKVTLCGQPVALTPTEYTLLQALMAAPGRVFSRQELLDHLYPGGDTVVDRVVDVHVGKLRQKIEADATRPYYILTVRGVGYQFVDDEA
jgi:DNA-binding response OmpR family regulator